MNSGGHGMIAEEVGVLVRKKSIIQMLDTDRSELARATWLVRVDIRFPSCMVPFSVLDTCGTSSGDCVGVTGCA